MLFVLVAPFAAAADTENLAFTRTLAAAYREYVAEERPKAYSRFRARYYLDKARRAEAGDPVSPEDPAALGFGGGTGGMLRAARERLIAAQKNGRLRLPALAAEAQARFDCWAERLRGQFGAADACRRQFLHLLELIEAPAASGDASPFAAALAREYMALAGRAAQSRRRWTEARHFASKARHAAQAKLENAVVPEMLGRWNLHSRREVPVFKAYRQRLLAAFAAGARSRLPAETAAAQVRFDCWVAGVAARREAAARERCRTGFLSALTLVESRVGAKPPAQARSRARTMPRPRTAAKRPIPRRAQRPVHRPVQPRIGRGVRRRNPGLGQVATAASRWTVFFEKGRDAIAPDGLATIKRAAAALRAERSSGLTIAGHAGREGSADRAVVLSLRRADKVRRALIAAGVPPGRIRLFARGTSAGAGRTNNRRVTIRLR